MAALIKELLFDIVNHDIVSHDTARLIESGHSVAWEYLPGWEDQCVAQCDITVSLTHLLITGQITVEDTVTLSRFLSGISTAELSIDIPDCTERLVKILALLEDATRYTDDKFLERVITKYPKYRKTRDAYKTKLIEYGRLIENTEFSSLSLLKSG